MGDYDSDRMKNAWNKSLYKIDGKEIELFKNVKFIEDKISENDLYKNENNNLISNVDLSFLSKYKVLLTKEIVVYKIPFNIEINFEIEKLRSYFKQIGIGKVYDNYILRLYLFKNLNYKF